MLRSLVGSEMCIRDRDIRVAYIHCHGSGPNKAVHFDQARTALEVAKHHVGEDGFRNLAIQVPYFLEITQLNEAYEGCNMAWEDGLASNKARSDVGLSWKAGSRAIQGGDASSFEALDACLLYTSDAADEEDSVDLGGRRIIKKKKQNKARFEKRLG
eukprot:TRINITY_DN51130_c0_g1_i3.p1 TRINITY_DN51130_c0_g1~~TRINITY_DN51130_c0_g1_i3.p1  ORF type:complete len:157 (+),score=50.68 TRINITY_DN51130_c0_g1_i3:177-647(+)